MKKKDCVFKDQRLVCKEFEAWPVDELPDMDSGEAGYNPVKTRITVKQSGNLDVEQYHER